MLRSSAYSNRYDVSGLNSTSPQQGNFNGPGPVIPVNPISSSGGGTTTRMLDDEVYTSSIEQSLELRLHTLSLGPRLGIELGSRLRGIFSAGATANFANWEAESRETLTRQNGSKVKEWQHSNSDREFLAGLYAELGLQFRLSQRWHLSGSGRYDWAQDLTGSIGPSTFNADLSGWTARLEFGWD